jgi:hypothetical protein
MMPALLSRLAESCLGDGDADLARVHADEAVALTQRWDMRAWEIDAQLTVARVRRRAENLRARPAIEFALDRARTLVAETGARGLEPHVHLELAALAGLTGDEATRQTELREGLRIFTEIGATMRAGEVAKELGLFATS